jgi:branched-chain amino acid aminotransferase
MGGIEMETKTIKTERASVLKPKPDSATLKFGATFTDHMFLMNYTDGIGWHDPRIVPYGPIALEPSSMVFHYAQEVFEGLKAYRRADGGVQLFRPWDNVRRLNRSCARLCIPQLDEELALKGIEQLVQIDEGWVPSAPQTSLYIRPFVIATDPAVGVHASHTYLFCIIACPVGSYYPAGMNPVSIYVESEDVRAVKGGTGDAKTGGNYAASLRAGERAEQSGYSQVLWLDGVHRKYIEEVGAMNVLFKINGEIVTPPLGGSILPGITRQSCLDLLKSWELPVSERPITVDELFAAAENGALEEAWGSGTAAVISPIGELCWNKKKVSINGGEIGPVTQRLYDTLTGIQWGSIPDPFGWTLTL